MSKSEISPGRRRLPPDERRRQLVRVAAERLTQGGVDAVQITDVAAAAGVTRPVVYRFFDNRQSLLGAVLEEFEDALRRRWFDRATLGGPPDHVEAARIFVDSVCDTVEELGAGAWHLLGSRGPDEVEELGRAISRRLIEPWHPAIVAATGASEQEVETVSRMIVAAGRAVLDRWLEGELSREEATRDAARGVGALLLAFQRDDLD